MEAVTPQIGVEYKAVKDFYKAKGDPAKEEAWLAGLPVVMTGSSWAFQWFLVSRLDEIKQFRPVAPRPQPMWAYTDTALQLLESSAVISTGYAEHLAATVGVVNAQKKLNSPSFSPWASTLPPKRSIPRSNSIPPPGRGGGFVYNSNGRPS